MRTAAKLLPAICVFFCVVVLPSASAEENLLPHSSEFPKKSQQELNALREVFKGKYRKLFFSANKPVEKEDLLARIKRGWELFNFFAGIATAIARGPVDGRRCC